MVKTSISIAHGPHRSPVCKKIYLRSKFTKTVNLMIKIAQTKIVDLAINYIRKLYPHFFPSDSLFWGKSDSMVFPII